MTETVFCRRCQKERSFWIEEAYNRLGLCSSCLWIVEEDHIKDCDVCSAVRDGREPHTSQKESCLYSFLVDLVITNYVDDLIEFNDYKEAL